MAFGFDFGTLFGGGPSPGQELQQNGWSNYSTTAAPAAAQSVNTAAAAPYTAAQAELLQKLQAQANGTAGPTQAQQQLQSGVSQTLAAQRAAMAGARGGNQNLGAINAQLGNAAATTDAGAAGTAAALRAQEQANAQSGAANLATTGAGQQQQVAETNAQLANSQWELGNQLNAQQQLAQNQAVAGLTGAENNANQTFGSNLLSSGLTSSSSVLNPISNFSGSGGVGAESASSDEAVKNSIASVSDEEMSDWMSRVQPIFNQPQPGAAAVPLHAPAPLQATPSVGAQWDYGNGLGDEGFKTSNQAQAKGGNQMGQALQKQIRQGQSSSQAPASTTSTTAAAPATTSTSTAAGGVGADAAGADAAGADIAAPAVADAASSGLAADLISAAPEALALAAAHGRVLKGPRLVLAGEAGKEAIVPLKDDGTPDEEKATGPGMADFFSKLKAHSYKYDDPKAPGSAPGTHYGPMAQELERTGPVGASTVTEGPDGVKRVDAARLALALAGAGAAQEHRLNTLEQTLKALASKQSAKAAAKKVKR